MSLGNAFRGNYSFRRTLNAWEPGYWIIDGLIIFNYIVNYTLFFSKNQHFSMQYSSQNSVQSQGFVSRLYQLVQCYYFQIYRYMMYTTPQYIFMLKNLIIKFLTQFWNSLSAVWDIKMSFLNRDEIIIVWLSGTKLLIISVLKISKLVLKIFKPVSEFFYSKLRLRNFVRSDLYLSWNIPKKSSRNDRYLIQLPLIGLTEIF